MKCDKNQMLLYAVTDRAWVGRQSLYEQVECALRGGATIVQLREKQLDEESFLAEGREIAALCRSYGVPLIINDNVELAIACGADGVHVGQEDMAASKARKRLGDGMILGVSAHNVQEALQAVRDGADYLGSGAVFGSSTKTNVSPMKRETLCAICSAVDIPVVAIGGVTKEKLPQLAGTGISGAAMVSAIFGAPDIEAECRELRALLETVVRAQAQRK